MGKKGSWLSALRRVFIPNSKEKPVNGFEKQGVKEKKKWGLGKLRHGDTTSFIPLYRQPSSVEKILGDAEREQHKAHVLPSRVHIDKKATNFKPTITPNYHQISAIKIQTAYRGYMARRSFRALKGLVRLQAMVRGQNVKRQTMNTMRCMRLLVRVQTQIHSRRIQMLENQTLQRFNNLQKSDKEVASSVGRWSLAQPSEIDEPEDWDDSVLTKEEIEARVQRKVEAVMKRERALAYAYSHQLWKATPQSAHNAFMEIRTGVYPWWWTSLERQLPQQALESQTPASAKTADMTPPKPNLEPNTPLRPKFRFENPDTATPRSTKSSISVKANNLSPLTRRALQTDNSTPLRHMKSRISGGSEFSFNVPLRDDESLTSCPPFSAVPNYMAQTVSAKAKVRSQSIHKEKVQATPSRESKKRFSFPLSQSIGSLRWNKASLLSNKDSNSQRMNHKSMHSIGNLSVDSTISLPVGVGRKGFK